MGKSLSKFLLVASLFSAGGIVLTTPLVLVSCSSNTVSGSNPGTPGNPSIPGNPNPPNGPNNPGGGVNPPSTPNPDKPVTEEKVDFYLHTGSLSIKNKSSILPSQMINLDTKTVKESFLEKKYDPVKITDVSFKLLSFSDLKGEISIKMYFLFNGQKMEKDYHFNGMLFVNKSSEFYLTVGNNKYSKLSAFEVSKESTSNPTDTANFLKKINDDVGLTVLQKNSNVLQTLPYSVIDAWRCQVSGFDNSWFNTNDDATLTFSLYNPKITYYEMDSEGKIVKNTFDFPSNATKSFEVKFYSAVNYLLQFVEYNQKYIENERYNLFYYGDVKFNGGIKTQLMLVDGRWLSFKKPLTLVDDNRKEHHYQVVLAQNSENMKINHDGSISVNIQLRNVSDFKIAGEFSKEIKKIVITSVKDVSDDLFYYGGSDANKLRVVANVDNLESNLNKLKRYKEKILRLIEQSSDNLIKIDFLDHKVLEGLFKYSLEYYFNGEKLFLNADGGINSGSYYFNDYIYFQEIWLGDYELYYNKTEDVFQLKMDIIAELGKQYSSGKKITVNVTEIGQSLENLKNLKIYE